MGGKSDHGHGKSGFAHGPGAKNELLIAASSRQGKLAVVPLRDGYGTGVRWAIVSDGVLLESHLSLADAHRRVDRVLRDRADRMNRLSAIKGDDHH